MAARTTQGTYTYARVRERDLARAWARPSSHDRRGGRAVVRRAEGRNRDQRPARRQESSDRMDPCHLERLLPRQPGQDPRKAAREHRLPGAGRSREKDVVPAGGRDLESAPCALLATHVGEVRPTPVAEVVLGQR